MRFLIEARGREVAIAEADVVAWVAGYTTALGLDDRVDPNGLDARLPERHRRVQLLQLAEQVGCLRYVGMFEDDHVKAGHRGDQ